MRVGRLQAITAIVMAYAVMVILVSPAVPSPLTTLRSKQTVQPPNFVAPAAVILFSAAMAAAHTFLTVCDHTEDQFARDIVDLTTARLC